MTKLRGNPWAVLVVVSLGFFMTLLDKTIPDVEHISAGRHVRALLPSAGGRSGPVFSSYREWTGAHWRLVSLVELGIPVGEPRALRAAGTVLDCAARC
jgi:hypothetical protein